MSTDEITDRLYALPPEEFTQARNQAERELRKAGEPEQADRVKALRKPTAVAAVVNQLVRRHRAQVEAFLAAAARPCATRSSAAKAASTRLRRPNGRH